MAIKSRPGFQMNVERTTRSTEKRTVFLDIKPGETKRLRFTPTSNEDGSLFFVSAQHFKLKDEGQPRAFACLNVHGTEDQNCPGCLMIERAVDVFSEEIVKKLKNDHGVSYRWHAQVVPLPREGEDKPEQTFVIGLSKMTADDVSKIGKMESDNRMPNLTDVEEGQVIQISRNNATGFATRYKTMGTGLRVSLDTLLPTWEEKFLDTAKAINLRVVTEEKFYKAIQETVGVGVFAQLFPNVKL
jgi:gp32-like DNA binding protein